MDTIRTEQLSKCFGCLFRLGPVDIRVRPGEILGVIGPNWAGKTTLLKLLWGFMRPDLGRILVFGLQPHVNQMRVRRRAGYVSQIAQTDSPLTAKQYLRFVSVFYNGWNEERAGRLLEQIGLNPDVKLEQLSPGGRMKLSIVSAVAHEPQLLLLDEPTSGLDSLTRFEILRFLSRLAREQQVSVVLSSNISEDLDHITDSVLMLRNGRVVEYAQTTVLNNAD